MIFYWFVWINTLCWHVYCLCFLSTSLVCILVSLSRLLFSISAFCFFFSLFFNGSSSKCIGLMALFEEHDWKWNKALMTKRKCSSATESRSKLFGENNGMRWNCAPAKIHLESSNSTFHLNKLIFFSLSDLCFSFSRVRFCSSCSNPFGIHRAIRLWLERIISIVASMFVRLLIGLQIIVYQSSV